MGGPCFLKRSGESVVEAPNCTSNFHITKFRFPINSDWEWYSVEQCFQAQKFSNEEERRIIQATIPASGESEDDYGNRIWEHGNFYESQRRAIELRLERSSFRSDWEEVKVEIMLQIVMAMYASKPQYCQELLSTSEYEIVGGPSTWEWEYWNGQIQMHIRCLLQQNCDLEALSFEYVHRSDINTA